MTNNRKKYNVILGSASPRRRQLMEQMGVSFSVARIDYNESKYPAQLQQEEIAVYLAHEKSKAFGELKDLSLLITADTIVWHNNKVLGKPADFSDAAQMLTRLSNQWHEVITGVCLRSLDKTVCFHDTSRVKFAALSQDEIRHYIETYKPYDKAGAYGIQEWIGLIGIESVEGSYFNVMGLPTQKLYHYLNQF
ncbi:MAG TPA: Maf family nucleotide pyrophosphatase [Bacteroidales bacterium]|nr:septum formation protein Maf [Bacteroidales bacterium]HOE04848.1 Maf family nucleotide pyrophosphatase [Bacteroidales bacterium]HQL69452.1 Maf family nucleotide pyrophosphatase [Bacteroidales bacterium]